MLKQEYFSQLYQKNLRDECSPAEVDELLEFLRSQGLYQLSEAVARHAANKKYPTDPILGQWIERPAP